MNDTVDANINTQPINNLDSLFENEDDSNPKKLKPYRPSQAAPKPPSNPFLSDPLFADNNHQNNQYVNPFNEVKESEQNQQSQTSEVFDLLYFDTTDSTKDKSKQNDSNNNDAFYAFDFGQNDNDKNGANGKPLNDDYNDKKLKSRKSQNSSDSYTSSSEEGANSSSSSSDQKEVEKVNIEKRRKDLKILPPTKQPTRTKKRRQSNSKQTENERAFDKLHKQFDPSLVGTVPVNQIHAKSREQTKDNKRNKKRRTEPVNIHSARQKQLKEEGLIKNDIQSPNIGKSLRNKNKNKKDKKEEKAPAKKSYHNVLPELHRGTALLKYGRRGYPHFRQFNITADNEHLRWFSAKKKLQQSSIDVGCINEILTGQHTKEFRRIAWTTLTPASFSIIYENKKKSLNLVAKSVDEMKMWVEALRRLRDMKKKGENLKKLDRLEVEVDFRDRNRPQSRNHSGNFLRSHETKERQVDPMLQRKLIDDIAVLRKQFIEISREANNPIVQSTKEYESIEQILSELEERIEELDHEVRNTRNTKIAENDVWRTRIDLESLREKIRVIKKQHKKDYKQSQRRWSVF